VEAVCIALFLTCILCSTQPRPALNNVSYRAWTFSLTYNAESKTPRHKHKMHPFLNLPVEILDQISIVLHFTYNDIMTCHWNLLIVQDFIPDYHWGQTWSFLRLGPIETSAQALISFMNLLGTYHLWNLYYVAFLSLPYTNAWFHEHASKTRLFFHLDSFLILCILTITRYISGLRLTQGSISYCIKWMLG
jgi:hypothetical protein